MSIPVSWRQGIVLQTMMLSLAFALAGFSLWILLAELLRSNVRQLPTDLESASLAANVRTRAGWAAGLGGIRGDLRAESAFTYAILLWPISERSADRGAIENQARSPVEGALAYAPYESGLWLLAASLASRLNWPSSDPAAELKMSYYTGPNEAYLIPLRLLAATQSGTLTDGDLVQLVQRDVRNILTLWPGLRAALIAAYKDARPNAKRIIESAVAQTEPNFLATMRADESP
jgi:hypothetical protein